MIDKDRLRTLLPHAGDMCLLDTVVEWSASRILCSTRTHLLKQNPLRRHDRLAGVHAVEYAAQAMAIHGSLLARTNKTNGDPMHSDDAASAPPSSRMPASGMLAALRGVKLYVDRLDRLDTELKVAAERRLANADGLIYEFNVEADDRLIAAGRLIVALT